MKPSEVMPANNGGGGTICDWLPKTKRTISTKHDAKAERDQQLVFMRPAVEMADDDALHQDADERPRTASRRSLRR